MAYISSVIIYSDKHEAEVRANGEDYRITLADFQSLGLCEGQCDDGVLEKLAEASCRLSCIKKAFSLLSYGDLSKKRLYLKLCEKFEKPVAQSVSQLMLERGYINENASAERFACHSADTKLWGPNRIKSELIARGYEREAVALALEGLDDASLAENLSLLIDKKMPSGGIKDIKTKNKLCAYLQRMGYSFDMINTGLKAYCEQGDCFGD